MTCESPKPSPLCLRKGEAGAKEGNQDRRVIESYSLRVIEYIGSGLELGLVFGGGIRLICWVEVGYICGRA